MYTRITMVFLLLLSGSFFHCDLRNETLSEEQIHRFAVIYSKYLAAIAGDTINVKKADAQLQQLLQQFGMTQEQFNDYRHRLEKDPLAFKKMMEIVNENLKSSAVPPHPSTPGERAHRPLGMQLDTNRVARKSS